MNNVPIPPRMDLLPRDPDRPYFPVPWFVYWNEGKPDYRVIAPGKIVKAVRQNRCWLCGQVMGSMKAFVIGPMCAVNRTSAEPPSHCDCAEYAVKVCPFMTKPAMKRNEKNLPEDMKEAAGFGIKRNPGVVLVWETKTYTPFRAHAGEDGVLFEIGNHAAISFWAEGRAATREEILLSIDSGIPILRKMADEDPKSGAHEELDRRYNAALALLPPSTEPEHVCDCCDERPCVCGGVVTVQEAYSLHYAGI